MISNEDPDSPQRNLFEETRKRFSVKPFCKGPSGKDLGSNYAVTIGEIVLYFSYDQIIGFKFHDKIVVTHNIWKRTTGKHINSLEPDHSKHLPLMKFLELLDRVLVEIKVSEDDLNDFIVH